MMDGSGLSVADAIALEGRNNCCNNDGLFGGDGGIWVLFLLFLLAGGAWGNNGWGNGNGVNGAGFQGYATRADINISIHAPARGATGKSNTDKASEHETDI